MDDIGGVWRTIGGRRIFIKDNQDLATAMKESGKFKKAETKYKEVDKELENKLQEESNKVYALAREQGTIGGLNTYTEEYYADVNYYLREGKFADNDKEYCDFVKRTITDLDRTIKNYNLQEDIVTYKGTSSLYYDKYKEGEVFILKDFNSTSIDKQISDRVFKDKENPYMLEIRVPKGTKGMYLGRNSANSTEKEFLIDRNTKYKVISKENNYMILEVIKDVK